MKFDLGWGNSVAVREAFLANYLQNPIVFAKEELAKFDYPDHYGDPESIELTRQVIKRQLDLEYKHVFMVNGATGGCVIAMRAYQQRGAKICLTREAPYYVRYPRMIQAAGLQQITTKTPGWALDADVHLIDLPSNPLGLMSDVSQMNPVILDGVYLNKVYMSPLLVKTIKHDVLVGSYSKLLGINGIRLGWIATNDDLLADRIKELVASEYCGLSTASTVILKHSLYGLNWEGFETSARFKLDVNREEFALLERFFSGTPVPNVGMFYYAPMDAKAQEIFQKAGINWTKGSAMGTSDDFARFNIGQNNEYVEQAVKAVLKADRLK